MKMPFESTPDKLRLCVAVEPLDPMKLARGVWHEAQKELVKDISLHITEAIAVKDSDTSKEMAIRAMPEDYWQALLNHYGVKDD